MNKKVYIQPQIFFVPLQTESLLTGISGTNGGDGTGNPNPEYPGMGEPGTDTGSKEHFGSFDKWDSWD